MSDKKYLQDCAVEIDKRLPDNHGFILMALPFGEPLEGGENRLAYVSSMSRKDAINMLKEWLLHNDEEESWMKHIK